MPCYRGRRGRVGIDGQRCLVRSGAEGEHATILCHIAHHGRGGGEKGETVETKRAGARGDLCLKAHIHIVAACHRSNVGGKGSPTVGGRSIDGGNGRGRGAIEAHFYAATHCFVHYFREGELHLSCRGRPEVDIAITGVQPFFDVSDHSATINLVGVNTLGIIEVFGLKHLPRLFHNARCGNKRVKRCRHSGRAAKGLIVITLVAISAIFGSLGEPCRRGNAL